jgi:hypothetical protein
MPIHDWTRMLDGDFHHFHQRWIQAIADALNDGTLPDGYFALSDQNSGGPIPDVVTLRSAKKPRREIGGGIAVATAPPSAKLIAKLEAGVYAKRADRIVIRRGRGEVVSIIEIVSPGNKHSTTAIWKFIEKTGDLFHQGIHMLVVDLFPPTPRDPDGLQQLICDEIEPGLKAPIEPEKNRTSGSYLSGREATAYLDCFGVGDPLPSPPIFLTEDDYVTAPLESTYMEAWRVFPKELKEEMLGEA